MIANGKLVEYVGGTVVENFRMLDRVVSFEETSNVKWGAIGRVANTYDRVKQTFPIRYRIEIIYNNGKLAKIIVGANEENIRELTSKEEKEWMEHISTLQSEGGE